MMPCYKISFVSVTLQTCINKTLSGPATVVGTELNTANGDALVTSCGDTVIRAYFFYMHFIIYTSELFQMLKKMLTNSWQNAEATDFANK